MARRGRHGALMLHCSCGYAGFTTEVSEHIDWEHSHNNDHSHQLMEG
ncbi:hypothetical protein KIY73_gp82 [Mycobacterium phage Camperdownii]|uniref:Uncharacterized protein n=1 Tax=Mycobacterium phage Camperdownii TaxID=1927024 RepID=A0A1L5C0P3_9CAUD|nr:hypothetical protein KIY73_gp82 [Mycobacterium phage Camperdownii]APL99676.1 hypothetical protein SEA_CAMPERDOWNII_82 [Mycobacterium phage Camperdownii]